MIWCTLSPVGGIRLRNYRMNWASAKKKLRTYNELPKDYQFMGGEIVYLEKKRRRATKEYIVYVVRQGDSMYSISQKFGIRLKNLYKLNKMEPDSPAPKVGDILRLR